MLRLLIAVVLFSAAVAHARGVRVLFDPRDPSIGPFPSDYLTLPDGQQKTGLRVNMPLPNCTAEPATCTELTLIDQFDGFSLQPRIHVRFSGPVDPNTLRAGMFFVWLDQITRDEPGLAPRGYVSGINEVVWNPATNTAYARPDDMFDQSRRYALVVTDALRDRAGDPVEADAGFVSLSRVSPASSAATTARAFPTRLPPQGSAVLGSSARPYSQPCRPPHSWNRRDAHFKAPIRCSARLRRARSSPCRR
jgi:hypothetical protein